MTWRCATILAAVLAVGVGTGGSALAAPGDWVRAVRPIQAPAAAADLPLPFDGAAAPAAIQEGWAEDRGQRLVYDVIRPALIPVSPPPAAGEPARPAVILVPGGGFEFLAIDNEGFHVAERLRRLNVRVFILKYRTLALPGGFEGFRAAIGATFAGEPRAAGPIDIMQDIPIASADVQAAVRAVRADAARLGVDPRRIGLLGFSAGAVAALTATEADAKGARPDFLGLIYGPTHAAPVPAGAPPLFDAIAADDRFFGKDDLGLIEAWRRSGASVEFHLYSAGGHGFASQPQGTTSDAWFDQFALWLSANGFDGRT